MRKDVGFGLTVGAILVATLIVYVIVLSGGGLSTTGTQDSRTIAVNTGDTAIPVSQPPAQSPAPAQDGLPLRRNRPQRRRRCSISQRQIHPAPPLSRWLRLSRRITIGITA